MRETGQIELEIYLNENREKLIGFITEKTGDSDLAEDLLQESLLKALRGSSGLKDKDKLIPWFYRIIRNAVIDLYRKQGREEKFIERYAAEMETELIPEEERNLCRCFIGLIPSMNEDYATIIREVELGDGDPAELAKKLGISRNSLKVKRYRARQQFKERLEQTCRTCAEHGCLDCTCAS